MTDKEKIKAEIERLKSIADYQLDNCKVDKSAWSQQAEVCKKLLSFINSMPEMEESDRLTHSVTKISDQEPEEYKGVLGEQLKIVDNEIARLEKLKVKEVDLEKEYEEYVVDDPIFGSFITNDTMGMKLAKHFFELGLKAQKGE